MKYNHGSNYNIKYFEGMHPTILEQHAIMYSMQRETSDVFEGL